MPAIVAAASEDEKLESLDVFVQINTGLKKTGLSDETSRRYALFSVRIIQYVREHKLESALDSANSYLSLKDVSEQTGKIGQYSALSQGAQDLGLSKSVAAIETVSNAARDSRAISGFSVFVTVFQKMAEYYGIPLNECSMAIAQVALDFAGALAATTGIGIVVGAIALLSVGKDSYTLGAACSMEF